MGESRTFITASDFECLPLISEMTDADMEEFKAAIRENEKLRESAIERLDKELAKRRVPLVVVLSAYESRGRDVAVDAVLIAEGYHPKKVAAKLEKCERLGYVDYGVTVRFGRLTDKGRAKLNELRTRAPVRP